MLETSRPDLASCPPAALADFIAPKAVCWKVCPKPAPICFRDYSALCFKKLRTSALKARTELYHIFKDRRKHFRKEKRNPNILFLHFEGLFDMLN